MGELVNSLAPVIEHAVSASTGTRVSGHLSAQLALQFGCLKVILQVGEEVSVALRGYNRIDGTVSKVVASIQHGQQISDNYTSNTKTGRKI